MEGLEVTVVCFTIITCFVSAVWFFGKRMEQRDLNYRAELKASPSSWHAQKEEEPKDLMSQLVEFIATPEGQKILSALFNRDIPPKE